jgi:hypothetical protein
MRRSWSRGLYPHGLLCGFLMSLWAFWARGADLPLPLAAVILSTPYFGLSGLLAARRQGGLDAGMVAGAATAVTGYAIVSVGTVCYTALNESWGQALLWVVLCLVFVFLPVLVGGFCGLLGAAVVRLVRRP